MPLGTSTEMVALSIDPFEVTERKMIYGFINRISNNKKYIVKCISNSKLYMSSQHIIIGLTCCIMFDIFRYYFKRSSFTCQHKHACRDTNVCYGLNTFVWISEINNNNNSPSFIIHWQRKNYMQMYFNVNNKNSYYFIQATSTCTHMY